MLGGRPSKPGLLQTFLLMRLDTGNLQYKPNILVYIISRFWKVLPSYLKLLITTNKSISTNFCKNFLTYFIGCSVCHFKTEDLRGTLLRDIKLPRSWSSGKPRYPGFLWSKVHISTEKLPLLFWKIFQLYLLWNFAHCRPWRPGKVSIEPPEMDLERQGIQALLFREKTRRSKNSDTIVSLLAKAIEQYKSFR